MQFERYVLVLVAISSLLLLLTGVTGAGGAAGDDPEIVYAKVTDRRTEQV